MATAQEPTTTEQPATESTAVAVQSRPLTLPPDDGATGSIEVFASHEKFRHAQRMAVALSESDIVPKAYRKNVANCLVAMELASRIRASVIMVMQNLFIIDGKPGWSAAFLVGTVNTSGEFSKLRYDVSGGDDPSKDSYKVRAYATDLATGEVLYGEWITWAMVKAEGWFAKAGSKWKTMPGQMFRYRAAAFWVRSYAPEIALGMQTAEEVADTHEPGPSPKTVSLNEAIKATAKATEEPAQSTAPDVTIEPESANAEAVKTCDDCGEVLPKHIAGCPNA